MSENKAKVSDSSAECNNDAERTTNVNEEIRAGKYDLSYKATDDKKAVWKFVILSAIGLLLFLFPVKSGNGSTIIISLIADVINGWLEPILVPLAIIVCYISAIGALYAKIARPNWENRPLLKMCFETSWFWIAVRIIAVVLATCVKLQVGPAWMIADDTAGTILNRTIPYSLILLITCGFMLGLLLEYGLMEFTGVLVEGFFRKVFHLPGRAAVDCLTSWLGASDIAVIFTDLQYQRGNYTAREAAAVMTCFSAGSITSVLVFLSFCDLSDMFIQFYLTVTFMGIICACIIPRIPPVRLKPQEYYKGINNSTPDEIPEGYTKLSWAFELAVRKAKTSGSLKQFLTDGRNTTLSVLFKATPSVLTVASVALMIAYYTNIFEVLGAPFIPLFKLFGFEEATAAASTIMGGFADNYIPCILAGNIISDKMLRMVICLTAYNCLIFMSNPGSLMAQAETPLNVLDLFVIFLERVILSIVLGSILCMGLSGIGLMSF